MITEGVASKVVYNNTNKDEITYRTIVPVHVPNTTPRNISAIDVSSMSLTEIAELTTHLHEYNEYKKQFLANMLSFESFVEHTTNVRPNYAWRSFKPDQLTEG